MKYFFLIAAASLLVILYVWQNIEIVKMDMEYRRLAAVKRRLAIDNNRIRYEIERFRRMDRVVEYAARSGMRRAASGDCDLLVVGEQ